ncbi:MAG: signal peptidase I [Candidatus Chisholmbacteria bacterium RIFCSPLOWO2_01_FULL_50_28]|uniref:Signal peptidase I n=1 Tax=Candidatus Chisholmbacteria bacterium RIFCSPHIGHO2_01_FULL_52_32 TaxID=1797591 RepID=A0A1G1VT87_9BACT|nr:MAG: signal peptidase I [Candidatus Chisholmbacteria bacterium RIFCSPHIGHO2_01_FULL_52_32]OGY20014.1 MAG: signal peptidase I [Candidatus Chisholmbacteria bacterium RIFCSPLOWO2_01_FULL_50_28]
MIDVLKMRVPLIKGFFVIFQVFLGTAIVGTAALLLADHFGVLEFVKPYVVMSGSMEPAVRLGSVVVVRPQSSYSSNDVVTYAPNGDKEKPVTHRILFKSYPDGITQAPVYLTKGDANEDFDRAAVSAKDVIGKSLFVIPFLGYVVNFAKQPYGFIFLVIVPATIVIYEEFKFLGKELSIFLMNSSSWLSARISKKNGIRLRRGINLLSKREKGVPKAAAVVPVIGTILVLSAFTGAFFSDTEQSSGNVFSAAESFGPPIANHLVINEVYYDVAPGKGDEGDSANPDEWVELYNPTSSPVDIKDWSIGDDEDGDNVSSAEKIIPPGGFALIAKSNSTWNNWDEDPDADKIPIGDKIGNGLANAGDTVILLDDNGAEVDRMSWGNDTSGFTSGCASSCPTVAEGHSLERDPDGVDTNTAADFVDRTTPTPGT